MDEKGFKNLHISVPRTLAVSELHSTKTLRTQVGAQKQKHILENCHKTIEVDKTIKNGFIIQQFMPLRFLLTLPKQPLNVFVIISLCASILYSF